MGAKRIEKGDGTVGTIAVPVSERGKGRPPKLTDEIRGVVVKAIHDGLYLHMAASLAGVNRDTIHRWMKRGEQEDFGVYREFYDAVKLAEAQAAQKAINTIHDAFEDNWQAAAWYLERKYPREWGRFDRHEHEGKLEIEHKGGVAIYVPQNQRDEPRLIEHAEEADD